MVGTSSSPRLIPAESWIDVEKSAYRQHLNMRHNRDSGGFLVNGSRLCFQAARKNEHFESTQVVLKLKDTQEHQRMQTETKLEVSTTSCDLRGCADSAGVSGTAALYNRPRIVLIIRWARFEPWGPADNHAAGKTARLEKVIPRLTPELRAFL